jgi:3-dehydroquinate dehydratase II
MRKVFVLNGPNMNMLGVREPEIYGRDTLEDIKRICEAEGRKLDLELDFRQTSYEGELLEWIHEAHTSADGVVINAGALGRTSISLVDAVKAVRVPVIEINMTNIYNKESYRPPSILSVAARGVISGFGRYSYLLGLQAIALVLNDK